LRPKSLSLESRNMGGKSYIPKRMRKAMSRLGYRKAGKVGRREKKRVKKDIVSRYSVQK